MKYSKSYRVLKDIEAKQKRIERHFLILAISLAISAVIVFFGRGFVV